jgi:membrane associated rhomboid family serine protease
MNLKLKMKWINFTITNLLAFLCILVTTIAFIKPELYLYWINSFFYSIWDYPKVLLQFFTGTFLHWWVFHLFMNMVFLVYFWNIVEEMMWKTKFSFFFIFVALFEWLAILFLWEWNTVWISGFNLAILTYYALRLYETRHPEFQSAMVVIIINIMIWFTPWISLLWHSFWALWWLIFYYLLNKNLPFDFEDFTKK